VWLARQAARAVAVLATWSRNRRRSLALRLGRLRKVGHQQGPSPPARKRPPVQLPAMISHISGAVAGSQERGLPVLLNPAGPPPRRDRVGEVT